LVFPCEKEMEALAMGALRVLKGEKPQRMQGGRVIKSLDDLLKEVQG